MMFSVGFFTPVRFQDPKTFNQRVQEGVDDYFYLGGKSAYIIPGNIIDSAQEVVIRNKDQNKIKQVILGVIKIISYMTVIIPLIMLVAKVVCRSSRQFHIVQYSVPNLMNQFTEAWNQDHNFFNLPFGFFNRQRFTCLLANHTEKFQKFGVNNEEHFGYIEKFDLDPEENPHLFMRADLHGDLKSLIENIRSLQAEGLLDRNFRCNPGVHLVFLGDYCDRGSYGTEILELLMGLREENPTQVHLIRGNHEDSEVNQNYAETDPNLLQILKNEEARADLDRFYETMPLSTYFSVDGEEHREYVQCSHGLFELTMDPAPLLDEADSGDYVTVPKERILSERIRRIADSDGELAESARRIDQLIQQTEPLGDYLTAYNWADVSNKETKLGHLGARKYALSVRDIRHYLDLSSEQHRVMMIFRGHEHEFKHHMDEERVVVTTLPVGMDSPYNLRYDQPDRAYIIRLSARMVDWTKRGILRMTGRTVSDSVTHEYPLISQEV